MQKHVYAFKCKFYVDMERQTVHTCILTEMFFFSVRKLDCDFEKLTSFECHNTVWFGSVVQTGKKYNKNRNFSEKMFKVLRIVALQRQIPAVNFVRQFAFKSDISTEALYPNSKQKPFTPSPPPPVSVKRELILKQNSTDWNVFVYFSERMASSMDTSQWMELPWHILAVVDPADKTSTNWKQKLIFDFTSKHRNGFQMQCERNCLLMWAQFVFNFLLVFCQNLLKYFKCRYIFYQFAFDFQYKNQINRDGYFVVKSELTRYQHMNLADALERVRNIIRQLEVELTPKEVSPEKLAVIQRRHEKAARERLFIKRIRSQTKADRLDGWMYRVVIME